MVSIEMIRVEVEYEEYERILVSVPEFPGVMAYDSPRFRWRDFCG
jgi:hypothetical protein